MHPTIIQGDATRIPLSSESVDCVVTSPPYNCGMDYEGVSDDLKQIDYECLAANAAHEIERVLVPGGRAWVNVPSALGRSETGERIDLARIWKRALRQANLLYRDMTIWLQGGHDGGCQWGSYLSPNAPNQRGGYEVVLCYFKATWKLSEAAESKSRGRNEVHPDDWPELTRNVWTMPTQPRSDHPAPFPRELPRRCILLSTYPGDVVLDPFCGTGTTPRTAVEMGRRGIGIELSPSYAERAARPMLRSLF